MTKIIISVAAICLYCSSAFAADYCDTKYKEYIDALKSTTKIMDQQKEKYYPALEKAHQLCKENKMEQASKVMDDLKDKFFHDALTDQKRFFGH